MVRITCLSVWQGDAVYDPNSRLGGLRPPTPPALFKARVKESADIVGRTVAEAKFWTRFNAVRQTDRQTDSHLL
jgi:hypothetical protein